MTYDHQTRHATMSGPAEFVTVLECEQCHGKSEHETGAREDFCAVCAKDHPVCAQCGDVHEAKDVNADGICSNCSDDLQFARRIDFAAVSAIASAVADRSNPARGPRRIRC